MNKDSIRFLFEIQHSYDSSATILINLLTYSDGSDNSSSRTWRTPHPAVTDENIDQWASGASGQCSSNRTECACTIGSCHRRNGARLRSRATDRLIEPRRASIDAPRIGRAGQLGRRRRIVIERTGQPMSPAFFSHRSRLRASISFTPSPTSSSEQMMITVMMTVYAARYRAITDRQIHEPTHRQITSALGVAQLPLDPTHRATSARPSQALL